MISQSGAPGIKWIRYRSGWAHGYGDWEYTYFRTDTSNDHIEDYVDEISRELRYDYSDKFRGMSWEETVPPQEIVNRHINISKSEIIAAANRVKLLKNFKEANYDKETSPETFNGCD